MSIISYFQLETENEYLDERICYICNTSSGFYCKNLYETKSKHTATRVGDLIAKWLGENPTSRYIGDGDNCVCFECLDKINEFDYLYMRAKQIEKKLCDTFLRTESKLNETESPMAFQSQENSDEEDPSETSELMLDPCTGKFVDPNALEPNEDDPVSENAIRYSYVCATCNITLKT